MFFNQDRIQFFKPLTSKYREQVVQCLNLLYARQFSANADYAQAMGREQLVEILEEALIQGKHLIDELPVPITPSDTELDRYSDHDIRFKNQREQANWILKQLLDAGWIERQVDTATLQSTFPFTRMGRVFTQALVESDTTQIRTRHRNTRNTLNALEAFSARGEVYDLLDAYEYSERIITDFTDTIAELEEKKRQLVKNVEAQQGAGQATDQFFEYMDKRFKPDISIRLSADSVEKHREQITKVIKKIRRADKVFKKESERKLRKTVPDLCAADLSFLWFILDTIEQRMRNAAEVMLPALRTAMHSFTKRADIIIRQLSYLNSQQNNNLLEVCRELSDLDDNAYTARIQSAANKMAALQCQFVDPSYIKIQERKQREQVDSLITTEQAVDKNAQQELIIQQLLDQAFVINQTQVKDYVIQSLKAGKKISTRDLPVKDAKDLLALAHITEVGAVNSLTSDFQFEVKYVERQHGSSRYYKDWDEFSIELIDKTS